jgi:hypothetical protein
MGYMEQTLFLPPLFGTAGNEQRRRAEGYKKQTTWFTCNAESCGAATYLVYNIISRSQMSNRRAAEFIGRGNECMNTTRCLIALLLVLVRIPWSEAVV